MDSKRLYIFLAFILYNCGTAPGPVQEKLYYSAPLNLPNVSREMNIPGFWISRLETPDRIILNTGQIKSLNGLIMDQTKNIVVDFERGIHKFTAKEIYEKLLGDLDNYKNLYTKDGIPADRNFYSSLKEDMNIPEIKDPVNPGFGYVTRFTDKRVFPTSQSLYKEAFDLEFDEIQMDALDTGTPVVVIHESKDHEWAYVQSSTSEGWIQKQKILFMPFDKWKAALNTKNFVIATLPKTEIFLNPNLTGYYDYILMGVRLPFSKRLEGTDILEIWIPNPNKETSSTYTYWIKAYVKESSVSIGYLPYTQRTMLEQAFKFLNTPYGWGGFSGEQDCSKFLQAVYACVGIKLPRGSFYQGDSGISLFQKGEMLSLSGLEQLVLKRAVPGITFFQFANQGHIAIYIGSVNNKPYIIHNIFSFPQKLGGETYKRLIRKVTISDLSLGEGTEKKSLLERIQNIRKLDMN
jgi:hypothetical protein